MREKITLFLAFLIAFTYTAYLKQDIIWQYLKELYIHFTPKPTVSVLISAYNMGATLPIAIASITAQTYTDWEIVIIDDGSIDKTQKILRKYRLNPKIRIIKNHKNLGLIASLNKGLKLSRGKYIARLDADDISFPDRIERQVMLMEAKNLDISGAWCQIGDYFNTSLKDNTNSVTIGLAFLKRCVYCHSTVMLRKDFLTHNNLQYNSNYQNAEDYQLWMTIFLKGGKFGFLGGKPLSKYHASTHSTHWFALQRHNTMVTKQNVLSTIIPNYNDKLLYIPFPKLFDYIFEGNKQTKILDQKELLKCKQEKCYLWEF